MVRETIPEELGKEGIALVKEQRRLIRLTIRKLELRRKIVQRLLRNQFEAHRDSKTGTWDSAESRHKFAELAELHGNFQRRIGRLGGQKHGPDRAGDLYH